MTKQLEDPKFIKLREQVSEGKAEAHNSRYSVHLGGDKMYEDSKLMFCWLGMKRNIAEFVAKYLTCQKVKSGHNRHAGLTKLARFIPMNCKWDMEQLACAYIKYVIRYHGILRIIVCDRDTRVLMAQFEALYGRRCRNLVCWVDFTESATLGPEMLVVMTEQVKLI
ncbi:uncharacterized protein LOC130818471 [Amaranthus tricolor]|uniref:uncharacterized protein LOC130818471 n=1 Tax=Amaranthus tricolor TaxID=29722 RepID=UPI002583F0C8|nr:uncharacterized protein LOC130818471 [Amaranthus tricolor]